MLPPFIVQVCADLRGRKVNLELPFPSGPPGVNELTRAADDAFTAELQHELGDSQRGSDAATFRTVRMQVFDDTALQWTELSSSAQLAKHRCQVYAFRPTTGDQPADVQQAMPSPRPPRTAPRPQAPAAPLPPPADARAPFAERWAAPPPRPRQQQPQPPGDPAHAERARAVYAEFGGQPSGGGLTYNQFGCGFMDCGINFAHATVDELWMKADADGDGKISWAEWQAWAAVYPNLVECIYHRTAGNAEAAAVRGRLRQVEQDQREISERERRLREELDQLLQRQTAYAAEAQQLRGALAASCSAGMSPQESDLVEHEIRLERQRDRLRMQRARFDASASSFDTRQQAEGSPRRAQPSPPA
eukprot:TRINITY_DN52153_c0_g1_i1.p1 TRINITY_DN52153_c0_g1~~TRINITY_DN52153_c0_g1_i1.p1  ORF type:complete len:389 (+),score=135.96 TRINITY_DN52153_c0_g1_i1:85-1167(+)